MRHIRLTFILAFFVQFCLSEQEIFPQDWSQWRGPNRDGFLSTLEIPEVWPEKLQRIWQIEVGEGHASPVVAQNNIFIFSRQAEKEVVSRIDLKDGNTIWRKSYPAPYTMNSAARSHGKGPKSTPSVYGDKLITLGISGILSCYDETGEMHWRKQFSKEFKATSPIYGTAMSPLVMDGLCIAHVGGHDDGALIAVDLQTGKIKWKWSGDGPGYASPMIATFDGSKQIVTFSQEHVIGIDFATGGLLWQIPFQTPWVQNIVTPLLYKNDLILSGLSQGIMRIKVLKKDDAWSTEQVWHNPDIGAYMSSPVLFDNLIVAFSDKRKGLYVSLDAQSGKLLWQSQGREGSNAALIRAGDMLISLNTDGNLIVAKRAGPSFLPVKEYGVADSPTWAHPVILNKRILIKDKNTLALWSLE